MREGLIADPERRSELEQSLQRTLGQYRTIHNLAHEAMLAASLAGNSEEAERQARRSQDWLRQVKATETTLDKLQKTGIYQINHAGEVDLDGGSQDT